MKNANDDIFKRNFIIEKLPICLSNMKLRSDNELVKQNIITDNFLDGKIIVSQHYYKRLSLYKLDK
jgi:hypothetical protein